MIRVPYVKDKAQVEKVIEEAKENNGIICYTVVSPELREHIAHKAMEHDVEAVSYTHLHLLYFAAECF